MAENRLMMPDLDNTKLLRITVVGIATLPQVVS